MLQLNVKHAERKGATEVQMTMVERVASRHDGRTRLVAEQGLSRDDLAQ